MKIRQLKDYQLECFKKEYQLNSKDIVLFIDDEKKHAHCVLNKLITASVDYWYAVLYF